MKTKTKKKRALSPGFLLFLLLYILALLGAVYYGLSWFTDYMAAYEQTRPDTAVRAYVEHFDRDYLRPRVEGFISGLDGRVQSPEESFDCIWDSIGEVSYARHYDPEGRYIYALKGDGETFGSVTFAPGEEKLMGFSTLEVAEESFDFSSLLSETELTVPEDYRVVCGGYTLDADYIEESDLPYGLLEEFYDSYELPHLVKYRVENYLGQIPIQVLDAAGQPVAQESLNEDFYTDNCTPEEKDQVSAFVNDYIDRYVTYLSSSRGGYVTYGSVISLVQHGSELYDRLSHVSGLGFVTSRDSIESISVNQVMRVADGLYICSITYLVNTQGHGDLVTTTNNAKLVLVSTPQGLRAAAQVSV